ncbi:MAG TPA: aconitate hydratase AcnA [Verrucomicrobiales bacterium]|nr:aconitate hydratase AcnA [Verrucomicrobiales bacterium]
MMDTRRSFRTGAGAEGVFYSLPALRESGAAPGLSRLPVSLRIVLESVLRNCDGKKVTREDVLRLANWKATEPAVVEIPFTVARIVLQDFTGVPLLVDLAAMRSAVQTMGGDPGIIEPLVPVDLVVDHSVQVDFAGSAEALMRNLEIEFLRNRERYEFLKWGQQAFRTFSVVPPGIGIVHQVNLEYLAKGVLEKDGVFFPDTLVGTDSHTTMINGLGVVGWGVGGIEAEAGMLGQPITFLTPEVVGVHMTGSLGEGVTATDLALEVTQLLRNAGVVGQFVEFYGEGARRLTLPDRATIANMAPEYGATMGFFPVDEETLDYLGGTGRSAELCETLRNYFEAQEMFGIPAEGQCDYSRKIELDLGAVTPAVAGPKRPQDRVALGDLKERFRSLYAAPVSEGGFGRNGDSFAEEFEVEVDSRGGAKDRIGQGSVLIAAITSCTNTSNPSVMLAAGLVARNANARGLRIKPSVKTSLAPGSRVVTDYLERTGLQKELDQLGFQTVGYGCTTCIGNSGPLDPGIENVVKGRDLVAASVLSGNRNFEARVHQSIRANFLMSPPLVVAYAIAGTVDIDLPNEPLGKDSSGADVFLRDIWPPQEEIREVMRSALHPEAFTRLYSDFAAQNPKWNEIPAATGGVYAWDSSSTYIQHPPFFEDFSMDAGDIAEIRGARALGIFGDSVTTDHISPAGAIKADSPAGAYLLEHGVREEQFNSYGSRRGNDRVMTRGTFANVRIQNRMTPGIEGGVTVRQPGGERMSIFDAAERYREGGVPLVVFGGADYGMGSSRDWAAKGTRLLGVRAVITKSFERIHRSNLAGMGVLPLNFQDPEDYERLALDGTETFDILGLSNAIRPRQAAQLVVRRKTGETVEAPLCVRLDTPAELDYFRAGGILPYVLAQLLRQTKPAQA